MAIDRNLVCRRCGGTLVEVRKLENGRKVFDCDRCHDNECLECVICRNPRGIWADNGAICGCCALQWMEGKLVLSGEQKAAILEWQVAVKVPVG